VTLPELKTKCRWRPAAVLKPSSRTLSFGRRSRSSHQFDSETRRNQEYEDPCRNDFMRSYPQISDSVNPESLRRLLLVLFSQSLATVRRLGRKSSSRRAPMSGLRDNRPHIRRACAFISTSAFMASAGLLTSRRKAMRAPRIPSWVFNRT
jgi:hypothetical protein